MNHRLRRPSSPAVASMIRAQRRSGEFSCRSFLAGTSVVGASGMLSACATAAPRASASRPSAPTDRSATDKRVNWANWAYYLDYDEDTKTYPTLEAFGKLSGLETTYDEVIEDNDEYYGKIQGQLANGQDIGKDIIVFTDYMAAR